MLLDNSSKEAIILLGTDAEKILVGQVSQNPRRSRSERACDRLLLARSGR